MEGGERAVIGVFRSRPAHASLSPGTVEDPPCHVVKRLAGVDPAYDEIGTRLISPVFTGGLLLIHSLLA